MRKETTEVTEDEELTTLGILSAHFARRYHFILFLIHIMIICISEIIHGSSPLLTVRRNRAV